MSRTALIVCLVSIFGAGCGGLRGLDADFEDGGRRFEGPAAVRVDAVAGMADGAAVMGSAEGGVRLGGVEVSPRGGAFVAVIDGKGRLRWALGFAGTGHTEPAAIERDASGDLWLVGSFDGRLVLGSKILKSAGGTDCFAARLTAAGDLRWARAYGGSGDEVCRDLVVTKNGDAWVVGGFYVPLVFGPVTLESAGGDDVFVMRLTGSKGGVAGAWRLGGDGDDDAHAVSLTGDGGLLIGGAFTGAMTVGDQRLEAEVGRDAFVAAFDLSGTPRWGHAFAGAGRDAVHAIAVDDRVVYAAGVGLSDDGASAGWVAGLDRSGAWRWTWSPDGLAAGRALFADDGGVLIAGEAWGPVAPPEGATVAAHRGGRDALLARVSADGALERLWMCGGTDDDRATSVSRFDGRRWFGGEQSGDSDCAEPPGESAAGFVAWRD